MVTKIDAVLETIKEGQGGAGKWVLVKVLCDNGKEATGLNLKEKDDVYLRYNDIYKNYNAIKLSQWQVALFDELKKILDAITGGVEVTGEESQLPPPDLGFDEPPEGF